MIDEKALEAIRLTLEWDERRGYLMPYAVRDKLRLAYESAKQKGEAEGWVLVPREPTDDMMYAGKEKARDLGATDFCSLDAKDIYRAMLSAGGEG